MPILRAAVSVVSPEAGSPEDDPSIAAYYRDLVEPFGSTVDSELLRTGRNVAHREIVSALAADDQVAAVRPGLVVLAQALPDVLPFTAVAAHLNMLLGGQATSFGISEQGLAAPFTALRVIDAHQREGCGETAVLAIVEQTTLPSRYWLVHDTPLVDSGVLLLFGSGAGPSIGGVERVEDLGDRLRSFGSGTLLVLGPWVTGVDVLDVPAHRVGPGSYCTSVWLALAEYWRQWRDQHDTVVLAETDPVSGDSHLAIVRFRQA
ncbi:hypothetical protein BS329_39415 [Amycolatopsis coloradensis]|uniref:Uncharacterized protein n=1 Tax=Amycolatopsis coloradensis TaxID=76021 RepID=A0A1R0KEC0_9PSEU|nr:hypothetical protein [Amycolatopsis coloradensis]OLZ43394.1 hypothetical protein BS329_39415 [Amycolatopsis coloradensis]